MKPMVIIDRIGYIGFANFILFMILSLEISGDALSGFTNNGEYYVSDHGKHTQVDVFTWYLSRTLGLGTFVFIPLAIVLKGSYYLYRLLRRICKLIRNTLIK
jgi:Trk-type K+ transport system membrane component